LLRTPVLTYSPGIACCAGDATASIRASFGPMQEGDAIVEVQSRITENLNSATVSFILTQHEALSLHSYDIAHFLEPLHASPRHSMAGHPKAHMGVARTTLNEGLTDPETSRSKPGEAILRPIGT
jgi:hypothetical protein